MDECKFRKLIEDIVEKNDGSIVACESERLAINAVLSTVKPAPESDPPSIREAKSQQLKAIKLYLDALEVAIAYLKNKGQ